VIQAAVLIINVTVLELPRLFGSPLYVAVILTAPAEPAVTVTEHCPAVRVQETDVKLTVPLPDWVQLTAPVGAYPLTTAVHVELPAGAAERERSVQDTFVFVTFIFTARGKIPNERALRESPL
jgi:hypothetical protein